MCVDTLLQLLAERMGLLSTKDEAPPEQLLDEVSLQGIATYIKSKCLQIVLHTYCRCTFCVSRHELDSDDWSWHFNR